MLGAQKTTTKMNFVVVLSWRKRTVSTPSNDTNYVIYYSGSPLAKV